MPGWLGEATPESFVVEISLEHPLPCHQTINYDDPAWKEKWIDQVNGNICAGSLILSANICKRPRDPKFPRMRTDKKTVFATHQAFLEYHNNADVKSWEFDREPPRKKKKKP